MVKSLPNLFMAGMLFTSRGVAQQSSAQLLKAKKYQNAIESCQKVLATDPTNAIELMNLGLALEGQGDWRKAIYFWHSLSGTGLVGIPRDQLLAARCGKVMANGDSALKASTGVIADLVKKGDFRGAEAACRKKLEAQPDDRKALLALGLCFEGGGRWREAADHWEGLRTLSLPGMPSEGELSARISKLKMAETACLVDRLGRVEKQLESNPMPPTFHGIALLQLELGNPKDGQILVHAQGKNDGIQFRGTLAESVAQKLPKSLLMGEVACNIDGSPLADGLFRVDRADLFCGGGSVPIEHFSMMWGAVGTWQGTMWIDGDPKCAMSLEITRSGVNIVGRPVYQAKARFKSKVHGENAMTFEVLVDALGRIEFFVQSNGDKEAWKAKRIYLTQASQSKDSWEDTLVGGWENWTFNGAVRLSRVQ